MMDARTRGTLTRFHLLLAAFIFPAVLMYIVTGSLYTWGIKGSYLPDETRSIQLDRPLTDDTALAQQLMASELATLSISPPTGEVGLEQHDEHGIEFEWEGSQRVVLLTSAADSLQARLTVRDTTWYRNLVQLHKAKGGTAFKVYAVILAICLFASLASGFFMAWQVPRLRRLAGIVAGLGLAMFMVMFSSS